MLSVPLRAAHCRSLLFHCTLTGRKPRPPLFTLHAAMFAAVSLRVCAIMEKCSADLHSWISCFVMLLFQHLVLVHDSMIILVERWSYNIFILLIFIFIFLWFIFFFCCARAESDTFPQNLFCNLPKVQCSLQGKKTFKGLTGQEMKKGK